MAAHPSPSTNPRNAVSTSLSLPNSGPLNPGPPNPETPQQSWWESISRARARIHSLATALGPGPDLGPLADSDRPATALVSSPAVYAAVSAALSEPLSGSGADPVCQWLYETFQSPEPELRLVTLAFLPLVSGIYLSRVVSAASALSSPSLAGFEAVLLSVHAAEAKARAGKPITVRVPDLSHPSLYHTTSSPSPAAADEVHRAVAVLSPAIEPQTTVKSTRRAGIVAVALECFFRRIAAMPAAAKLDFCRFAGDWAGEFGELDDEVEDTITAAARIPLPWELMQIVLRILGHCLLAPLNSDDVRQAAAKAVRRVHGRACHDLMPAAILAARSLIQLDKRAREAATVTATAAAGPALSNPNTPSKPRKPEVFLSSK